MATFIIADLHLSTQHPELLKALDNFYQRLNCNDKVIILGDFVDFFVGIDYQNNVHKKVRELIGYNKTRGITTFFICGNRDFLINKQAADFFNFTLLKEETKINTPQGPALLLHGDELCVNDPKFQRFRHITKNPILRGLFRALPLYLKKKIGLHIRQNSQSQEKKRSVSEQAWQIILKEAKAYLNKHSCRILIHGHFHIFANDKEAFGKHSYRLALGSWGQNYSYVKIDEHNIKLIQKPLCDLMGISPIRGNSNTNS